MGRIKGRFSDPLVDDKLALTTDLFEIKEEAGEQKRSCLTIHPQGSRDGSLIPKIK